MESDIREIVRQVLIEELAPIMMGKIVSNKDGNRSTVQRTATDAKIPNARNIEPFGFRSRAPVGTQALLVPIDGNPSHVNVVGHFDESAPGINDGESVLYNQFGQLVYLSNGKIQIGSKSASENLVLGQVFKTFMASLLQLIADHTHPGIGYPPSTKGDFEALKASPIQDGAILSDESFTQKGG